MVGVSKACRARRFNAALAALRQHGALAAAANELAAEYGMSLRPAYRYVREAERLDTELFRESKMVFTAKLLTQPIAALAGSFPGHSRTAERGGRRGAAQGSVRGSGTWLIQIPAPSCREAGVPIRQSVFACTPKDQLP